ncbi:MAG: hypothetical protein WCS37_12460 [Chloroflexota bacterium]|nr:hypothetical protein [Chloroflexota bacterium]
MKRRIIGFLIGGGLGTGAFLLIRHWWNSQNLEELLPAPVVMRGVTTESPAEEEQSHNHSHEPIHDHSDRGPRIKIKQRDRSADARPLGSFEEIILPTSPTTETGETNSVTPSEETTGPKEEN